MKRKLRYSSVPPVKVFSHIYFDGKLEKQFFPAKGQCTRVPCTLMTTARYRHLRMAVKTLLATYDRLDFVYEYTHSKCLRDQINWAIKLAREVLK